jgi:hypothetical protein
VIPYIKDSWRGGISDEQTRGPRGTFKYAYGMDIHKRRDSLSCNFAMSNIGTSAVIKDLIKYSVTARDGSTYAFGASGSIYAIAGNPLDPVVTGVYNDENGEIKGAAEWKQSDGNNYLMWATNTSIARMILNGSPDTPWAAGVVTQDYKTTLDPADYHPMRNAGGVLSIGNNNFLATIDYSGTFNPASMNVRPGNVIKVLEERDDYTLMGSERVDESEEGHIWSWVTSAVNWVQKKKIPVKGVNAMIDTEKLLLQGGINGELFYSDFSNSAPLVSVPSGGQVNPGGTDILNDLALFGFYGTVDPAQTGIYSYGRRMLNRPFALNHEFRMTRQVAGSTITEIGSVWVASSAAYASWKTVDGSTIEYGIDMVSSTTRATARLEGLEFTGGQPHLKKQYKSEKVIMEPLPSGTSVNVIYRSNRQSTGGSSSAGAGWKYAKIADLSSTTYSVTDSTEAEFIINDNSKVYEIGIELTPSGSSTPEITGMVGYIADNKAPH